MRAARSLERQSNDGSTLAYRWLHLCVFSPLCLCDFSPLCAYKCVLKQCVCVLLYWPPSENKSSSLTGEIKQWRIRPGLSLVTFVWLFSSVCFQMWFNLVTTQWEWEQLPHWRDRAMTDPPWPKAPTLWRPGISQNPPKRYHLLSLCFCSLIESLYLSL